MTEQTPCPDAPQNPKRGDIPYQVQSSYGHLYRIKCTSGKAGAYQAIVRRYSKPEVLAAGGWADCFAALERDRFTHELAVELWNKPEPEQVMRLADLPDDLRQLARDKMNICRISNEAHARARGKV